ncbi:methyltransferase family protein [Lacipirellula sp.]|uniref:methyltransferase family protein n=1 Tax=Lacipirellula sp. TaxID=2691419 RepID=UPI003D09DD34
MATSGEANETVGATTWATLGSRVAAALVKRRVPLTSAFFVAMVALGFAAGVQPRDLTSLQDPQTLAGLSLVLAGAAIRSWAAGTLRKHAELTTVGPYSLMRNPLYAGSMMMMVGFCVLVGQFSMAWVVAPIFTLLFGVAVMHEEAKLRAQYGAAWDSYAKSTPRVIPRRLIVHAGAWSLKQWKKNREYQATLAACLGLVLIQAWQIL